MLLLQLDVRPVLWHQRWRLGPGRLDKGSLKPVFTQIRVLGHDELETGSVFCNKVLKHFEKPSDCPEICIFLTFGFVDGASCCFIGSIGRKIDLARLVNKKETRNGVTVGRRESVKGKESRQVVSKMVLPTAGTAHVYGPAGTVDYHGQMVKIEPRGEFGKFPTQGRDVSRHMQADIAQGRHQTGIGIVCSQSLFEIGDPGSETALIGLQPDQFRIRNEPF